MRYLIYIIMVVAIAPFAVLAKDGGKNQIERPPEAELANTSGKSGSGKNGKPAPLALDEKRFEFVRSNLISTFYHELAHALIDMLGLPVLGQEEDAADVFSVLMIEHLFKDARALQINTGGARGFEVDAIERRNNGREWDWADEHGADMQRYFNIVCLTYGANPETREDFARDMKLPDGRAEFCHQEYELASKSWAPIIKQIEGAKSEDSVSFQQSARSAMQQRAAEIIAAEVKMMNEAFNLPQHLRVSVKRCERGSSFYAYYTSDRQKITICTNYIDELYQNAPK